jgi:hypothetical protein
VTIPHNVGGCRLMDDMTRWIEEIVKDPATHEEWHNKYREHFRSGGTLIDIAIELQGTGLARDHDVEYIKGIPQDIHDQISAAIITIMDRDERWIFRWDHEPADEFAIRVDEDHEKRTATFTVIGPHEG